MRSGLRWAVAVIVVAAAGGAAVLATRPEVPTLRARLALWRRGVPLADPGRVVRVASAADDVELLSLLRQAGVALDAAGSADDGPLHVAAAAGAERATTFLLQQGAGLDAAPAGHTPLARALESGHLALARTLLERGAGADVPIGPGRRPALLQAVENGEAEMLGLLLEFGADPNAADADGLTPIAEAAARNDATLVRMLLAAGASPDVGPRGPGLSLLEQAIRDGDAPTATLLLAHGADPTATSLQGQPLLLLAVALGDLETTRALLDAGADVETAVVSPAGPEFLELVPGRYAEFYLTRDTGVTPLMIAVLRGDVGMARLLLARGASRGPTRTRHKYPLGMAANRDDVRMMQALLGRDPDEAGRARRLVISLGAQQARLHEHDEVVVETRVSTGRKGYATPAGDFVITDKRRRWRSTIYDVEMPYFMRLSGSDIGLHQGHVPAYPASHGCIRLPAEAARTLYARMELGDVVTIVE